MSIGCSRSDFIPTTRRPATTRRFRALSEAYGILSNPEKRARYDVTYQQQRQQRWRLVSAGSHAENDFEIEHIARLTVLEALYTKRRLEPGDPGIFVRDLEELTGRPREHLEFTVWYLDQRKFVTRDDNSRLILTADGVDFLEKNYQNNLAAQTPSGSHPSRASPPLGSISIFYSTRRRG